MAVMQILDEAKEQIEEAIRQRVAPDDEVRWDLSLSMVPIICNGHRDDEHEFDEDEPHIHPSLVLSLYMALGCPETETSVAVCTTLPHCPELDMEWWVDKVWTQLSVRRIGLAEFNDDSDSDHDECFHYVEDDDDYGVTF